jgi:glycerol kinase
LKPRSDGSTTTVLQGGVFTVGALLDWLSDGLGLLGSPREIDKAAAEAEDAGSVMMLPALSGLGAPWWRPRATGVIAGLTDGVRRGHLVRAAVDGIAHRVVDIVEAMGAHLPERPVQLRVDGGLMASRHLAQRQADLLGIPVGVAENDESTALGIAGLAGMALGAVTPEQIEAANPVRSWLAPAMGERNRRRERTRWRRFVRASMRL